MSRLNDTFNEVDLRCMRDGLRSWKSRAQAKIYLNAFRAFNEVVRTGQLNSTTLDSFFQAISSKSNPVWENITPLFIELTPFLPEAQRALQIFSRAKETHVRFHVTACLTTQVPRDIALEIARRGITDKGNRVREKAAEACCRLLFSEMIPEIEKQLAVENQAETRRCMELELRLLRDGFYAEPNDQSMSIWIRCIRGSSGTCIPLEEASADKIQEIVRELRAGDAAEQNRFHDEEAPPPLASAPEYLNRGHYFAQMGRLAWRKPRSREMAVHDYTSALELDPTCAEAFVSRGKTWEALGQASKASADFGQAVAIVPKEAHGFILRAEFWKTQSDIAPARPDHEKSLADYVSALALEADNPAIHSGLAKVYMKFGNLENAMAHANRAYSLNSEWGDYLCTRGEVFLMKGQYAAAFKDFNKGRLLVNGMAARNHWAWLMATLPDSAYRNGAKAAKWMTDLFGTRVDEPSWQYRSTLAAAYAEQANYQEAVHHQAFAIREAPHYAKKRLLEWLAIYRQRRPCRDPSGCLW